jgi:hypothetical protein
MCEMSTLSYAAVELLRLFCYNWHEAEFPLAMEEAFRIGAGNG